MMATRAQWKIEDLLAAFDEYLRRARGVGVSVRRNDARFVRAFLKAVFPDGGVDVTAIGVADVLGFIGDDLPTRYRPQTIEGAASALRSFFRFLRASGLRDDRLEDTVPSLPHRLSGLVRHLPPDRLEQLIASLDSSSPRGLRDRAILVCLARLGLRAGEVARLQLEDIDWRNAAVRVRSRKNGRGARLPLTVEVGTALSGYLQHGRPDTAAREVFVLHWLRVGAPISRSIVYRAVDSALTRAGMDAPTRGPNLLRHSLATELLARGAGLREIADVLGHASLTTTRIYAAVDIAALSEAALPWPGATS